MQEAIARAELVALPDASASNAVTIAIPRRDVEAALAAEDGPMDLVLDVAQMADTDDEQPAELRKIAISWEREQLEHLLQRADGDVVTVVFDGEGLARLVDPDFELHGLREGFAMLAVAVAAGTAAGVATAAPTDEGGPVGSTAGYTAIEQARGPIVTPDPAGGIEAVRSAPAAAISAPSAASNIEAVRSAEPLVAADSGLASSTADIEAVRSAEPLVAADSGLASAASNIEAVRSAEPLVAADSGLASATADIEAVRSTEPLAQVTDTSASLAGNAIEAVRSAEPIAATSETASISAAAGIEGVRSAEAAAVRSPSSADDGITISMPSPLTIGFVGGIALLLTGAAFVARGRRPVRPA
jgi:hypothetical protein